MITDNEIQVVREEYYNLNILHEEIRSYEVSLWTLQDEFITVLKWSDAEHKGRIEEPKLVLNIDGTEKFTFKIPMYISSFYEDTRSGITYMPKMNRIENPIWYNTRNGNLMESMRKIKITFNKGDSDSLTFELLIIKVTETHEAETLVCEVECEGLAFHELGKIGYKHSLSQEAYEYFIEQKELLDENVNKTHAEIIEEYPSTVDFWMDYIGIEKYVDGMSINPKVWYYKVEMNWDAFANVLKKAAKKRDSSKVYEEPYVASWDIDERSSTVFPREIINYKEKLRHVEIEESNLYNITQEISEKFGIFCRYEYGHDSNNHIISKFIIFYNNFMLEDNMLSINYPHKAKEISRSMDSTDLTTKLFVRPLDDDSTQLGTINISNSAANKTREDYILNFDYLYNCGAITQELYDAIGPHEALLGKLNNEIIPLLQKKIAYSERLPDLEAEVAVLRNSIDLDGERISEYSRLRESLDAASGDTDGNITVSEVAPKTAMIMTSEDGTYKYINIDTEHKGIVPTSVGVYAQYNTNVRKCFWPYKYFEFEYDRETNGISRIVRLELGEHSFEVDSSTSIPDLYLWSKSGTKIPTSDEWVELADLSPATNALSEDDIKNAPYLWKASYTQYKSGYCEVSYTVTHYGKPNKHSFYSKWTKVYSYSRSDNKPNKPGSNTDISTEANISPRSWSYVIPTYQGLEYDCYSSWRREKTSYKSKNETKNGKTIKIYLNETTTSISYTTPKKENIYDVFSTVKSKAYLTFKYNPKLYYDSIVKFWESKKVLDETDLAAKSAELGEDNKTSSASTGLYKTIYQIQDEIDEKIAEKNAAIKKFELMMGPAVREGYWDAEDYSDFGDLYEFAFSFAANLTHGGLDQDTGVNAYNDWDIELFDDENKEYYLYSAAETQQYYPCINLAAIFGNRETTLATIKDWLAVHYDDTNTYRLEFVFSNTPYAPERGFMNDNGTMRRLMLYSKVLVVGADAILAFAHRGREILPVLVLTGAENYSAKELDHMVEVGINVGGHPLFGLFRTNSFIADGQTYSYLDAYASIDIPNENNVWLNKSSNYNLAYPRMKISSLDLKPDSVKIYHEASGIRTELNRYEHFYINTRSDINTSQSVYQIANYITIKPEVFYRYGGSATYILDYTISNAATAVYLDALEVSKENYLPKVEYTATINVLDKSLIRTLYARLAQIIMVNDTDLKFNNVFGYISGVELNLNKPSEDTIEIKNYKTKFEDLFSTIVALTDAMKKNSANLALLSTGALGLTANGFLSTLEAPGVSSTLTEFLDEYLDGNLHVLHVLNELFTEAAEIIASSLKTLDATHVLTVKNAAILSGFSEKIHESLTPTITRGEYPPIDFKVGDIFIETDDEGNEIGRYVGTVDSTEGGTMTRIFDGAIAAIEGASFNVDADSGTIDFLSASLINLLSGGNIYIAANENVDIIGNKAVNIGGARINIAAGSNSLYDSGITMVASAAVEGLEDGEVTDLDDVYILTHLMDLIEPYKDVDDEHEIWELEGFRTTIDDLYDNDYQALDLGNDIFFYVYAGSPSGDLFYSNIYSAIVSLLTSLSKISIFPRRIEMASADIIMKGANKILLVSSTGYGNTSAIKISATEGVWIGAENGIVLYSGDSRGFAEYNPDSETISIIEPEENLTMPAGASVQLNNKHLLLGFSNAAANTTAMELTDKHVIIAAGQAVNNPNLFDTDDLDVTGLITGNNIAGLKMTKDKLGLAILNLNSGVNAIIMNENGITIGTIGERPEGGPQGYDFASDYVEGSTALGGSYVRINGAGVEIGSTSDLWVNTENVLINTRSLYSDTGEFQLGETIFKVYHNDTDNGIETSLSLTPEGLSIKSLNVILDTTGSAVDNNIIFLIKGYKDGGELTPYLTLTNDGLNIVGNGSFTGTISSNDATFTGNVSLGTQGWGLLKVGINDSIDDDGSYGEVNIYNRGKLRIYARELPGIATNNYIRLTSYFKTSPISYKTPNDDGTETTHTGTKYTLCLSLFGYINGTYSDNNRSLEVGSIDVWDN